MLRAQTLRQVVVLAGLTLCCFSEGFIFGQMSGMIDDLRNEGSTIKLSDEEISWLASIINVICFCGFGCMAVVNELLGRKKTIAVMTCPVIASWIMVYFAEDKTTLFLSRIVAGISFGGVVLITYVCIGEYVPPKTRALCLNMTTTVGLSAGTMMGHILSTIMHWRHVALVGIIPSTLSTIIPLFWEESPSWLASKGRFDESERAFKRLHLTNEASKKELKLLLINQKDKAINGNNSQDNSLSLLAKKTLELSKAVYFWKLCLLIFVLIIYRVVAGRILFGTFAISILHDITGGVSLTNSTLLVDGFVMLGTLLSCVLVIRFKLRSLILISGTLANVIQVLLGASLYFWQDRYDYVVWIKVSLLALYFIIVNAGPYAVIETLFTEIFPLDIKGFMVFMTGIICGIVQFLSIKFAPSMFLSIGYHGVFLINASFIFVCLLYLYYFLPETKGRTLQEIELYFKYNTFDVQKIATYQQENELLKNNTEI